MVVVSMSTYTKVMNTQFVKIIYDYVALYNYFIFTYFHYLQLKLCAAISHL